MRRLPKLDVIIVVGQCWLVGLLADWHGGAGRCLILQSVFTKRVRQPRVDEDLEAIFVHDEDLICKVGLFARLKPVDFLQVKADVLLDLVLGLPVGVDHGVALLDVLPNLIVAEWLLAARAEDLDRLEDLLDLVVDRHGLVLALALLARAHPHHLRVHTKLAEQVVTRRALDCWRRVLVVAWCDKMITQTTHEELEAGVHLARRADLEFLWLKHFQ